MAVSSTPAPRVASTISHAVALVLLAASATMNTAYGWSKGDTLPMQCVWAAIAAGSAIVFGPFARQPKPGVARAGAPQEPETW